MESVTSYIRHNILHQHTLSDTCQFSPVIGGYSDMPPACHPADIATPWLSIRCTLTGALRYETKSGGRYEIDANSYLILNENHPYRIEPVVTDILSEQSTKLFAVFFPRAWADDVYQSIVSSTDRLLEGSTLHPAGPFEFFEKRFARDELVTPRLLHLLSIFPQGYTNSQQLEENLYHLLAAMLHVQRDAFRDAERLPSARLSTRVELYRRLHLARDYMHASFEQPLSLTEIAEAAALSPYHFARCFKQAFGQTPNSYLTQLRLEKAQTLLRHTPLSVTEICLAVGFQSLPSFVNLFCRRVGVSPRQYRKESIS